MNWEFIASSSNILILWNFQLNHIKGKGKCGSDALSRFPWKEEESDSDIFSLSSVDEAIIGSISGDLSLEEVKEETKHDENMQRVMKLIKDNINNKKSWTGLTEFQRVKKSLYELNGMLMFKDRVVIPKNMREAV